jgi:hypothetical protein
MIVHKRQQAADTRRKQIDTRAEGARGAGGEDALRQRRKRRRHNTSRKVSSCNSHYLTSRGIKSVQSYLPLSDS